MAIVRHPRLVATFAATAVVLVLWVLSWGAGQGSAVQVAMQAMMPLPVAVGAWACAARLRSSWAWLLPLAVFALCVPLLYAALEEHPPDSEGSRHCGVKGFLPGMPDRFQFEDTSYLLGALVVALAGLACVPSRRLRWVSAWTAMGAFTWIVTFFASGVCVGS